MFPIPFIVSKERLSGCSLESTFTFQNDHLQGTLGKLRNTTNAEPVLFFFFSLSYDFRVINTSESSWSFYQRRARFLRFCRHEIHMVLCRKKLKPF